MVYWDKVFHGSIWQNPYKIGRDGTRTEVIKRYRDYLLGNQELMAQIHTLRGKSLGCWCYPDNCHGDVLVKLAESSVYLIF
jgi:hypothetical protein